MKVKGLWGLEVEPEKTCVVFVDGSFKISMASISSFQGPERTSVYIKFQDSRFLLCSLIPEKIEQQVIDITCLKGERISFQSVGPNCIHLMGNYVSQDDSESEEEIGKEEYAEKEVAEKEKNTKKSVDIANPFRYSFGYSIGGSVVGSAGDSDHDLYVDAPDLLDSPDMLNEAVPDVDEFDVGHICNFLETTFGPKEPSSNINNNSNISNPVTVDQSQNRDQNPTSPPIAPILVEVVENTKKHKLLKEKNTKKREQNAEGLEVEKLEVEQRVTDKRTVEPEKQKIEKQIAEKVEAERIEFEKAEAERVDTEKLKANELIIEKLKAEKLKAEKRVPKKRVHTRQEYVAAEPVELENTIPKNSVDSTSVAVQIVHDPRSERISRNETQILDKDQINQEYQSVEMADTVSASHDDQVKSNDVPCIVDTNSNTKSEAIPRKKARDPKTKGQSATSVKQSLAVDSSQENNQVKKTPIQKRFRGPAIPIRMSTRSKGTAPEITESEVIAARRKKSKSSTVEKTLKNTPVKSTSTETDKETDKETDVEKSISNANTKAKETLEEHIKEVDSITPDTETTPINRRKDKKPNASKEKETTNSFADEQPVEKSEEIITSTNLENTSIEPVEVERAPSKKTKDSGNKCVGEPVKKAEKTISQEEHIKTISSEVANTESISNKTNNSPKSKNRVKAKGLLNQLAPSIPDKQTQEEYYTESTNIENKPNNKKEDTPVPPSEPTHTESVSKEKIKKRKRKQNLVHNHTEEIPVELNEAEIPNIEITPKKEAKINKSTSVTRKGLTEDASQEIPTENRKYSVQESNDKLPTIPNPSHASSKETVTKEKNMTDNICSFEELLRREKRKKLAKLKKWEKKEKRREAKTLFKDEKEAGDSPKESSNGQKDIGAPASTPAANSTKETFTKQSNAKSPVTIESSAQQNRIQKRQEEEDPDYTPGAQRKKGAHKKRKLLK